MNNMNKSIGLLKSIMKKNYINKHQTMEINNSNRYSPSKKQKRQIISINKASKGDFNSNIEKKKIIYQQSIQKLDRNNKLKLSQNKKNMEINHYYKNNNILNGNNIPNNFKNRLNNSKTINNLKNKNYNTSLQKKVGSKSYVDLFQNNIYNSNDHIIPGGGKTISNSIYEKIYDFENENFNFINNANNNKENNSTNEYNNTLAEEANNIINILLNYINLIKKQYEKIIIKKMQIKDKEISKLKNENEFLIKENKNLKYKILEIFYCTKKYYENKNNDERKSTFSIQQLLEENLFLRKCINKTNNINKDYLIKLENDIIQQFKYKELLNQKKNLEEEKNGEKNKDDRIIINEKEDILKNDENNNPFKFINENNSNNSNNNKINHKRQKTQFKLNNSDNNNNKNENINNIFEEDEDNNNINNSDSLSNYLNEMNNNMLMSRTKNGSQKNLLMKKISIENSNNKSLNKENENIIPENNVNNNSYSEQSFDSIVHKNKENKINQNEKELNKDKDNINQKLSGMSNITFDKYSQRIEFTK